MNLLTILIPTYNRKKYVIKNLNMIKSYIEDLKMEKEVSIIVSDNYSEDSTYEELIKEKCEYVELYEQQRNIGLEQNVLFCIKKASSKFVMILGDDDYISKNYLKEVLFMIRNEPHLSVIIPNNYPIDEDGERLRGSRDNENDKTHIFKTFKDKCDFLLKAHQISGITFLRADCYEKYIELKVNNMYPQIFFVGLNMIRGKYIHLKKNPVKVTDFAKKYWKYTDDELMDDILNNFKIIFKSNYIHRIHAEIILINTYSNVINRCIARNTYRFLRSILMGKNSSVVFKVLIILKIIVNYIPIKVCKIIKKNNIIRIYNLIKNKKIIIFSASSGGRNLNHILKSNLIDVDYVCDNNKDLIGHYMQNIKITKIDSLLNEISANKAIVFIASKTYEKEIEKQLLKIKIPKKNILKYNRWRCLENNY